MEKKYYLRFRKPHHKHRENLFRKFFETSTRDPMASAYIPKSKTVAFGGLIGQKSFMNVRFVIGIMPSQSKGLGTHPG